MVTNSFLQNGHDNKQLLSRLHHLNHKVLRKQGIRHSWKPSRHIDSNCIDICMDTCDLISPIIRSTIFFIKYIYTTFIRIIIRRTDSDVFAILTIAIDIDRPARLLVRGRRDRQMVIGRAVLFGFTQSVPLK